MARIHFRNNQVDNFTYVLSNRSHKHYGQIVNIDYNSVNINMHLNAADEISFDVYKVMDGITEPLWDSLIDLKLVYVVELDEYFQIKVSLSDSNAVKKTITGTSLCECELSQTNLYGIEINTEDDIKRKDYTIPTVFYRDLDQYPIDSEDYKTAKKASLLHRILDKTPHYIIKHVDKSLMNLQRSFSVDGTSIYDFFTGDCAQQFNCLFQFDSTDRSVSVYDLYTVCLNDECNYRGEFNDVCPECGGTNLKYYGEDTTILVDKENLTNEINYETNIDEVKNCFKLVAGDDNITAAVRNLNPNGTDYIYYISQEQKDDMSPELVGKLDSYDKLCAEKEAQYQTVVGDLYECIDKILYYTSGMMPTVEHDPTNAQKEANKLTTANMSPLALPTVTTSTSLATVNSALKNYAKVYVNSGQFKIEINQGEFEYVGTDGDENNYGTWYGNFKISNYSTLEEEKDEDKDIAYSPMISVKIYDDYRTFLEQKVKKQLKKEDEAEDDKGSIYDVLSIEKIDKFKEALKLYGVNRLTSFYDSLQGAIDILIEADQASPEADLYDILYVPYYEKLQACQSELDVRQTTVDEWNETRESLESQRSDLQEMLNFENYIGKELYTEFCAYRREDQYSNDNFISDGLKTNAEVLEKAKDFMDKAKKELFKSGERQHTITSSLYNLLCLKEFIPIVNKFELGNWIRVMVDGILYRLRLSSYSINFNSIQEIGTEFTDATKTANGMNDIQSILAKAQSMSSSYSYVAKQAEKGSEANNEINKWVESGIDSSLTQITNNDKEEVTYDKYGLMCKSWDDVTESYEPEQLRITHNNLSFTKDNWKTASLGIGKHKFKYYDSKHNLIEGTDYGLSSKFVQAGYVYGSQIIGGQIYSENYSANQGSHLDLNKGTFSFAGGRLTWDGKRLYINSPDIPNEERVIQIAEGTITADYINALNIKAGSVDAENITGTIISGKVIEGSEINGATIQSKGQVTFYAGSYTQADITRADNIIKHKVLPTMNDYAKLDITGDGRISIQDMIIMNNFVSGKWDSKTYDTSVKISQGDKNALISTPGVAIGRSGIFCEGAVTANTINTDIAYLGQQIYTYLQNDSSEYVGITTDITINGKTYKVVNGLIVSAIN